MRVGVIINLFLKISLRNVVHSDFIYIYIYTYPLGEPCEGCSKWPENELLLWDR